MHAPTTNWLDSRGSLLGPAFPLALDQPFTLQMAADAGISPAVVRRLLATGLIRRVLRGVFAAAQAPDSVEFRARAIGLVVSKHAVVTDRAAAWLHGMPVLRRGAHLAAPPVEVCHVTDTRSRRPEVDGHRRGLLPRDVMVRNGIQLTTPLRTALDLGRLLWRFDALPCLDAAVRMGVEKEEMVGEAGRFRGYRGIVQLRALAPLADGRAESTPESALRLHWLDAGLPSPELQHWIYDDRGVGIYRLDVPDPTARYAAEYDGVEFHSADEDVEYDEKRREWNSEHRHWIIGVFTKDDVYAPRSAIGDRLVAGHRRARRSISRWTP